MTESDWYAVEQAEQEAQQDRLVVLADIWLDKPDTLDRLHTVFAGTNTTIALPLVELASDMQLVQCDSKIGSWLRRASLVSAVVGTCWSMCGSNKPWRRHGNVIALS